MAVLDDLFAVAVPALRGTPGGLQNTQRLGLRTALLDRLHQLVALAFRQGGDLRKQSLERLAFMVNFSYEKRKIRSQINTFREQSLYFRLRLPSSSAQVRFAPLNVRVRQDSRWLGD